MTTMKHFLFALFALALASCTAPAYAQTSCAFGYHTQLTAAALNGCTTGKQDHNAALDAIASGAAQSLGGLKTFTNGVALGGSPPTLTGTCTTSAQVGGNTAGKFAATCTNQTVILTFATTAANGWSCNARDLTTPADALKQTAYSPTSCTLTGTTVAADVIVFDALAF